ncbi:MAG: B-box zinc finger protein [Promethearchaeota archaeon]
MSDHICRFCQRYVKLTYFCEECGANCCSDCLHEEKVEFYSCQDCNSKNIEITESEKQKVCKECGSENVLKVNQLLKSCPKCGSHKIINIYEKKEELEKIFLELIKNSRLFINPLRETLDKLFKLRQQIKKARDPPIRCFHFPKMESDLLALFKLFVYVQNTLFDKINSHFHQMVLYKEYFFDIYAQPNSNITIIKGIFESLFNSFSSINEFMVSNIETFKDSINSFNKNLEFIEKIDLYFSTYKKFLNLADKEKPVYAIYAKLTNGLDTEEKYKKDKGILFITNLDLSFVHEHGIRKKKQSLTFKAPVQDLISIKEKGKLFKKLYIEFEYGKYEFTLPPKANSRVIEYILLARTFDETTIYDSNSAKKLQSINIDFNELENFIEESINSFFSLKCQYNKSYERSSNYNNTYPQNVNISPNHIQNLTPHNQPNTFQFPNPNIDQFRHNQLIPQNLGNQYMPNHPSPPVQPQYGFNTYTNPFNQYQGPNQRESKFFIQNLFNPNRYQNYNPYKTNPPYEDNFNSGEESIPFRDLEQFPRTNEQLLNQPNTDILGDKHIFQEYNRNHLSDLFTPNNSIAQRPYGYKKKLFKLDREKHEKMLELQKERYSLKATLKKLETKFDQGSISESDYFRTFRNLSKEIYLIENKISELQQKLEELDSLKQNSREFDNKGFYS